jgi:broad-specificity NMP kinase
MAAPGALFGAVLLLGAPGVGKSLLLQELKRHLGDSITVLNIGEQLREQGLVQAYQEHPTNAGRRAMAAEARRLLAAACRQLAETKAAGKARCAC